MTTRGVAMERSNTMVELTHLEPTSNDVLLGNASSNDDNTSINSLSTVEDLLEDDPLLLAVEDVTAAVQKPIVIWLSDSASCSTAASCAAGATLKPHKKEIDVAKYMAEREMTPFQERMNAITMIPNVLYCVYYILSQNWISPSLLQDYREDADILLDDMDSSTCCMSPSLSWSWSCWLPLSSIPPATIMAVFWGVTVHAPFSFLYHWKYAQLFPAGLERTGHWSRRMDHSMIHVASMLFAYAASGGNWDYTLVNILFNADCIYRQFKWKVRPRRNQIRVGMSILAYTIPILNRGDVLLFSRLWFAMLLAGWFFVKYPVGGWSHSIFHLILCGLPYYMMQVATSVVSDNDMQLAAQCAVLAERNHAAGSMLLLSN